jgi:hypothetical protein
MGHIEFSLFNISIIEGANSITIIGIISYYAKFCGEYVCRFVNMALIRDVVKRLLYSAASNRPGSFLYGILDLLSYFQTSPSQWPDYFVKITQKFHTESRIK